MNTRLFFGLNHLKMLLVNGLRFKVNWTSLFDVKKGTEIDALIHTHRTYKSDLYRINHGQSLTGLYRTQTKVRCLLQHLVLNQVSPRLLHRWLPGDLYCVQGVCDGVIYYLDRCIVCLFFNRSLQKLCVIWYRNRSRKRNSINWFKRRGPLMDRQLQKSLREVQVDHHQRKKWNKCKLEIWGISFS